MAKPYFSTVALMTIVMGTPGCGTPNESPDEGGTEMGLGFGGIAQSDSKTGDGGTDGATQNEPSAGGSVESAAGGGEPSTGGRGDGSTDSGGSMSAGGDTGSGGADPGGSGGSGEVYNLAFVSSSEVTPDWGSLAAYDQRCNDLAVAASLPRADGTNFVAWMSDASEDAQDRVLGYRGWTMVDGTPFANLLTGGKMEVFNNINQDENGTSVTGMMMTGTISSGVQSANCDDWTIGTSSSSMVVGRTEGGPVAFTNNSSTSCNARSLRLLCLMTEYTTELIPQPAPGKVIYLTNATHVPGTIDRDAACESSKPPGSGTVKALVATTSAAAEDLLDPKQLYVRPDGIELGLGSEISAGSLRSGIWQLGNGQYANDRYRVWVGQSSPSLVGTLETTCNDWSGSESSAGYTGHYGRVDTFFSSWPPVSCSRGYRFYCVEQ